MTTTVYKYCLIIFFLSLQIALAQRGSEALLIKEDVLLKCDNNKIPSDGRVELPRSVKTIATDAFKDCNRLRYVSIAASVTAIGDGAFVSCTSLLQVSIANQYRQQRFCFLRKS